MFKSCATIFFLSLIFPIGADNSPCADWEPYKDEKCYKIISTISLIPFEDAERVCEKNYADSRLISIKYPEEQAFLANFIFNQSKIVDPVWIDARFKASKLVSDHDGKDQIYTNWAPSRPTNSVDNCIMIDPDSNGKWMDEKCSRSAKIVCEAPQRWTLDKMQLTLEETVKRFEETQNLLTETNKKLTDTQTQLMETKTQLTNTDNRLNEAKNQLDDLKRNPVPIGFIYTQLTGQPEPITLWPTSKWEEVSATYAGLFFRVNGGGAAQFGTVQEENSPRLNGVKEVVGGGVDVPGVVEKTIPANNDYSPLIMTGTHYYPSEHASFNLQLRVSSGEVRPRNQAVRLWKRSG